MFAFVTFISVIFGPIWVLETNQKTVIKSALNIYDLFVYTEGHYLHRVIIILQTECNVVVVLVGKGTLWYFTDVILIRNIFLKY